MLIGYDINVLQTKERTQEHIQCICSLDVSNRKLLVVNISCENCCCIGVFQQYMGICMSIYEFYVLFVSSLLAVGFPSCFWNGLFGKPAYCFACKCSACKCPSTNAKKTGQQPSTWQTVGDSLNTDVQ